MRHMPTPPKPVKMRIARRRPVVDAAGAGLFTGSQTPLTQLCDSQSAESMQLPPLGTRVLVGVAVPVAVGVRGGGNAQAMPSTHTASGTNTLPGIDAQPAGVVVVHMGSAESLDPQHPSVMHAHPLPVPPSTALRNTKAPHC